MNNENKVKVKYATISEKNSAKEIISKKIELLKDRITDTIREKKKSVRWAYALKLNIKQQMDKVKKSRSEYDKTTKKLTKEYKGHESKERRELDKLKRKFNEDTKKIEALHGDCQFKLEKEAEKEYEKIDKVLQKLEDVMKASEEKAEAEIQKIDKAAAQVRNDLSDIESNLSTEVSFNVTSEGLKEYVMNIPTLEKLFKNSKGVLDIDKKAQDLPFRLTDRPDSSIRY